MTPKVFSRSPCMYYVTVMFQEVFSLKPLLGQSKASFRVYKGEHKKLLGK